MIWKVMRDENLGCNSYLLGDEVTGTGMVVDPLESVGATEYIMTAQDLGITINHVVETHVHADHRSGARELAKSLGLKVSFGARAAVSYDFQPLSEGQKLSLGSVEVEVLETPGHTPESISLVVRDTQRGDDPMLVMTGDSLFVGDVGRPDLQDAGDDEIIQASRMQFESVRKILNLPDYTELYPAHYGASKCGGLFMSKKPSSTVGYEKKFNFLAKISDVDEFVDRQMKLLKPPPEEAREIRAVNTGTEMEVN
ncbi:beta-lactamase [uncultured archaeon]|nr:beta-lactamase [uncultured archaeon]HKJ96351.1 MBL fold metallo-hydrolase [Thermoplasmataceae archaeon]